MKKLGTILGVIALIAVAGFSMACKTEEDSPPPPPAATANSALYTTWYSNEECTNQFMTLNTDGSAVFSGGITSYTFTATANLLTFTGMGLQLGTADYTIADKVLTLSNGTSGVAGFNGKYYCK